MSRFILVIGIDGESFPFGGIIDIEQSSQDPHYLELVIAVENSLSNVVSRSILISFECEQETQQYYSVFPFNGTIEQDAIIFVED